MKKVCLDTFFSQCTSVCFLPRITQVIFIVLILYRLEVMFWGLLGSNISLKKIHHFIPILTPIYTKISKLKFTLELPCLAETGCLMLKLQTL